MDLYNDYVTHTAMKPHAGAISTGALATMSSGALLLVFGLALMFPVRDIVRHRHDVPMVSEDGITPFARHATLPPPRAVVFVKKGDTFYHWHRDCRLLYFQSLKGHHWKIRTEPRLAADEQGKNPCFYCEELDRMHEND